MSDVGIPATPAGKKRETFSKKEYLDASGKVVDIDDGAVSLRYTTLADGKSAVLPVSTWAPEVILMNALFSVSTLATIEATRNRDLGADSEFASDTDAVVARFARMEPGNWGLKAPSGRLAIDVDLLLSAVDEKLPGVISDKEEFKALLVSNDSLRNDLRWHEEVAPAYDEKVRAKKAAALAASTSAPKASLADLLKAATAPKAA